MHGHGTGVPTARGQAAEYRFFSGLIIEMKGLRIELTRKILDCGLVDGEDGFTAEDLTG
jgi:hypothetical protein